MQAKPILYLSEVEMPLGRPHATSPLWFRLPSLEVAAGEKVALVGPSGCGKTTLLHVIAGLARPRHGEVTVAGQRVDLLRGGARDAFRGRVMGYVFQDYPLLSALTAWENVLVGLRFGRAVPAREHRKRATEVLTWVGLERQQRQLPASMSAGERQRVAVARALANRPPLLLADEPTGNLDPTTARQILELLTRLGDEGGHTLLMVTHDPAQAALFPRIVDGTNLISNVSNHIGSLQAASTPPSINNSLNSPGSTQVS